MRNREIVYDGAAQVVLMGSTYKFSDGVARSTKEKRGQLHACRAESHQGKGRWQK